MPGAASRRNDRSDAPDRASSDHVFDLRGTFIDAIRDLTAKTARGPGQPKGRGAVAAGDRRFHARTHAGRVRVESVFVRERRVWNMWPTMVFSGTRQKPGKQVRGSLVAWPCL